MKEKLLRLIEASRAKEEEVLIPHVDDSEPSEPGKWTTKDVVAHMTAWREVAAGEIDAVLKGTPAPDVSTDDDAENAKFYARTHHLPMRSIIDSAARSWDALAAGVEACSEEDLQRARPRHPNSKLYVAVTGNTYFHVAEHLGYWYDDQGQGPEAEKAALWGYDLVNSEFPEDRMRGVAEYNLGCLYAKRGMAAKALPRLSRAFELRPDLREHARTDTDLNPIRSNEELARLLDQQLRL